ncbi:MAG: NADH-quinone oxidoreductase subunit C [Phycisphaerae bacterium]|nr:NADH-quinone oxidoreductase subunit C [Phycisphaerae bacterium]
MTRDGFLRLRNGQAVDRSDAPVISREQFRERVIGELAAGSRLSAMMVVPTEKTDTYQLFTVVTDPGSCDIGLLACEVRKSYPALTPDCPAASWFEREMSEQWNIQPDGHPWLKPIRFQPSRCTTGAYGAAIRPVIGLTDFFQMDGDEIHEVAVGPVHAGVIEPGHFRFQCHGETVHHLEISLGYQHRGVERALVGGPNARTIHYMETLAGDTTVGHSSAYCGAIEALSDTHVPPRGEAIRAIGAELERMANHIGDLGALAGDVGFLPTMSYCGRIRGDALNITAMLCGNRFGRNLVRPGGVARNVDEELVAKILQRLDDVERDATSAIELMFDTPSVLARFEGTGVVSEEIARQIGLIGPVARASSVNCDVRHEFPYGLYRFTQMPVCTWPSGDCFARAYVRWLEVRQSFSFIREQLHSLPSGATRHECKNLHPNRIAVSLTEGWRGEICHVAITDDEGCFAQYKVVDPSFHNWFGLAYALRGQQISDFPLCNKSFNLSYCGHDL